MKEQFDKFVETAKIGVFIFWMPILAFISLAIMIGFFHE